MARIKKGDQVVVISGKDKGKTGRVLRIFPKEERALVENLNMVKKTQRPTQENQQGGFIEIERSLHISNIAIFDKKTNKPTRLGSKTLKDGTKVRISRRNGEVI